MCSPAKVVMRSTGLLNASVSTFPRSVASVGTRLSAPTVVIPGPSQVCHSASLATLKLLLNHTTYFLGYAITMAEMEALEDLAEANPERIEIKKKAAVTKLLKDGDSVVGVEYTLNGETLKEYGPVILATGRLQLILSHRVSLAEPKLARWLCRRFLRGWLAEEVPT